ncbi:MAG: phenylalanine--tRNA ligase subunit beta [Planctomycetota bacterium]|nr:phenylalanine--tRNA ligase subunit beta [Planctomycetota bacterium]
MNTSVRWLNDYLTTAAGTPVGVTPDEAEQALMSAGFPIESRETLTDGDTRMDVEITSNRGDCISHVGLAREVAAKLAGAGRDARLKLPSFELPATSAASPVASVLTLRNEATDVCPLFTARVIRGVKVGPSPAWLAQRLEAAGQRSINNVVDVTNFIALELGNPCHVFDLAKLEGATLVVRRAYENEPLLTLDGKKRVLKSDEIVVADARRAQSLAGVIGGGESEVSASTVDVVLEVATWDPVAVRRAARRLQIRTDASHRFERIVDARTLEQASRRAAALIVQVAGGSLCDGVLTQGRDLPRTLSVTLRASRCSAIIGATLTPSEIAACLRAHEIVVREQGDTLHCEIPAHRPDLTREIDLIEEVARTRGLDAIAMLEKLPVAVKPPQASQVAMREIGSTLTGMGLYEAVTFSFIRPEHAALFLNAGLARVDVDDDRRGEEPTLRPSVIPSLLQCRKKNADAQVHPEGGVRLYEVAAVFAQAPGSNTHVERRTLAMLLDVPMAGKKVTSTERQFGLRQMRGSIESLLRQLAGPAARITVTPAASPNAGYEAGGVAEVFVQHEGVQPRRIGFYGLTSEAALKAFGLEVPTIAAELDIEALLAVYPPRAAITTLPSFPCIERDLSAIVADGVAWDALRSKIEATNTPRLEGVEFVGTYRGKQIGAGKKSLTLRLRFRDAGRTLRHEEVDPEVGGITTLLQREFAAEFRT